MKNFCIYNGKKIAKPEIWNITSIELSGDYTSAIIQAESKSNKSEYNLDITPLIINQYKNGIDPYTATIVNELTGVSDWILDPTNNQIRYTQPVDPELPTFSQIWFPYDQGYPTKETAIEYGASTAEDACKKLASTIYSSDYNKFISVQINDNSAVCTLQHEASTSYVLKPTVKIVANPNYDPNAEVEYKTIPLETVAQKVISNAEGGDVTAQNSIVSTFNNMTDGILNSDYSEFFEQNKQPKQEG